MDQGTPRAEALVSLTVREGPRSVRLELTVRPTAARTTLLLLAGIWFAFAVVWAALVLAFGGSILLALASLIFLPAGLAAAGRVLAGTPERWTVEIDPGSGLAAARRGFLSRGQLTVPLADLGEAEVADRPGHGGLARPALRVATRTGERWLGEGHARADLERMAAVFNEGVRTARVPLVTAGTKSLA
ncbi:MAG: hypothetical protein A2177_12640 [Spirochaetes bacterium RBG_13_68_11]|nr:MAG: hypothetical protein A2177_12640 [Spirochaetes bacterium RBG_13_68_11]